MTRRRPPWYLLTGLAIGLLLGLLYSWLLDPVDYYDTTPASLRADFKDDYRSLIARAYLADGDLGRAQARLALLGDESVAAALSAQAQRWVAEGGRAAEAQALAKLAADLQAQPLAGGPTPAPGGSLTPANTPPPDVLLTPSATLEPGQEIQTATPSPIPVFTRRPPSPTATIGAPFVLRGRETVCDPNLPAGLLQVQVQNAAGQPVAGVRVVVTWDGGEGYFFTGLYLDENPGYADFQMSPNVIYRIRVGEGGEVVSDLSVTPCTGTDNKAYFGGWRLVFGQ